MKQEKLEKIELLKTISELTVQYEQDKKTGRIEANEKEREKIQAVKTLKKEMNFKVKETQANLMALNDIMHAGSSSGSKNKVAKLLLFCNSIF